MLQVWIASLMLAVTLARDNAEGGMPLDSAHRKRCQQPRQIEWIICSALRSSRSAAALPSPSETPTGALPPEESAVPDELVPGALGADPKAPPVEDEWWPPPIPPPPPPRP